MRFGRASSGTAAGFALALNACAPDAVKSTGVTGTAKPDMEMSAAELDRMPALTMEDVLRGLNDCGLPDNARDQGDLLSGRLATPGPLIWARVASGCTLGIGTDTARITVSPAVILSGPFTAPSLRFDASTRIESQCNDKFANRAATDAAPFQRSIGYEVVPVEQRPERIGQAGPWKKVICSLAPVMGIRHQYKTPGAGDGAPQSFQVQVEFIPALPAMVVPAAARSGAFARELGRGIQFDKIVARVTSSNDPRLPAGREITGTVTVTSIPPKKSIIDPDARTETTLQTDIGIRIAADFGGVQVTQNLGLFPFVDYFVDRAAGAITFMSTANPDPDPRRTEILYK